MAAKEITYTDIETANAAIKTTPIKGKQYAEVPQRIKAFRMVYPEGYIETTILKLEAGVVTMKAVVKTHEHGKILGVGHAQEKEDSTFVNETSFIENCETSAVGRALGMCGFGIDVSVASTEELQTAIANQDKSERPAIKKEPASAKQLYLLKQLGYTGSIEGLTVKQASDIIDEINEANRGK